MDELRISRNIVIPAADLDWEATRSGGPGGQHANTSDTRVRLRFFLDESDALPHDVKRRIRRKHPGLLTTDGELLISSGAHRSQHRNREEVRERLRDLVRDALTPPKKRRPTRPSRSSKKRREKKEKRRKQIKKMRKKPKW